MAKSQKQTGIHRLWQKSFRSRLLKTMKSKKQGTMREIIETSLAGDNEREMWFTERPQQKYRTSENLEINTVNASTKA